MHRDANWKLSTDQHHAMDQVKEILDPCYAARGFLPEQDPLPAFRMNSPYYQLDDIGRKLPDLLQDKQFRHYVRSLKIPTWQSELNDENLPALRLYYLRLGFLASAYINQVGEEPCQVLPANISVPLVQVCKLLKQPPILSYDGYALYNWRRINQQHGIKLGNIETLQNFVPLYDEHWFILVHVEIEALAAEILAAIARIYIAQQTPGEYDANADLWRIAAAIEKQTKVLRRIPEKMAPALYYKTFRPYIRFFENVVYQGVAAQQAMDFRGETGAQSSVIPVLVAFMKIPHKASILTKHLKDMRNYMPARHRCYLNEVAAMPSLKRPAFKEAFNAILDNIIEFRMVHLGWAYEYIHKHVQDPRGTGGTPYMRWLNQLIDETKAHKISSVRHSYRTG